MTSSLRSSPSPSASSRAPRTSAQVSWSRRCSNGSSSRHGAAPALRSRRRAGACLLSFWHHPAHVRAPPPTPNPCVVLGVARRDHGAALPLDPPAARASRPVAGHAHVRYDAAPAPPPPARRACESFANPDHPGVAGLGRHARRDHAERAPSQRVAVSCRRRGPARPLRVARRLALCD